MTRFILIWLFIISTPLCYATNQKKKISLFDIKRIDLDTMLYLFSIDAYYEKFIHGSVPHRKIYSEFIKYGIHLSADVELMSRFENNQLVWELQDNIARQKYTIIKYHRKLCIFLNNYPIWPELSLRINGQLLVSAPSDIVITVDIRYDQNLARSFSLKVSPLGTFTKFWTPLNNYQQTILPGTYSIAFSMDLGKQTDELKTWWKQKFGLRKAKTIVVHKFISSENYSKRNEQNFYSHRINKLNNIFLQMKNTYKSFKTKAELSKWNIAKHRFFSLIKNELDLIEIHNQKTFPIAYPQVTKMLHEYSENLFVMGNEMTNTIKKSFLKKKAIYNFFPVQVRLKQISQKCLLEIKDQ